MSNQDTDETEVTVDIGRGSVPADELEQALDGLDDYVDGWSFHGSVLVTGDGYDDTEIAVFDLRDVDRFDPVGRTINGEVANGSHPAILNGAEGYNVERLQEAIKQAHLPAILDEHDIEDDTDREEHRAWAVDLFEQMDKHPSNRALIDDVNRLGSDGFESDERGVAIGLDGPDAGEWVSEVSNGTWLASGLYPYAVGVGMVWVAPTDRLAVMEEDRA